MNTGPSFVFIKRCVVFYAYTGSRLFLVRQLKLNQKKKISHPFDTLSALNYCDDADEYTKSSLYAFNIEPRPCVTTP